MIVEIPEPLKVEYPFQRNFFHLEDGNIHYLDEGNQEGPVIVMLHGNPTWSFYYRNLVKTLGHKYRIIVPDHMGCGLSCKPQKYDYTLDNHIENTRKLLSYLKIDEYHLIVHDWGGAIGFGLATLNPGRVKSISLMNTAAFLSQDIPFRINVCRTPVIGELMVRTMNAFAWPATFMATKKGLNKTVKQGYLLPYNSYANRIATAKFVKDIPLEKDHVSYQRLKTIEEKLKDIKCPIKILWGEKDFCFTTKFRDRWLDFYPTAEVTNYPQAGHYVLEDEQAQIIPEIQTFIEKNTKVLQ